MLNSITKKIQQSIDPHRIELITDLKAIIDADTERFNAEGYPVVYGMEATVRLPAEVNHKIESAIYNLCDLDTEILEQLRAHYSQRSGIVEVIIHRNIKDDVVLRETMAYPITAPRAFATSTLNEVRVAFAVYDLSAVSDDQKQTVEEAMKVALDSQLRNLGRKHQPGAKETRGARYPRITSELVSVIADHPNRAEDIVGYMQSRDIVAMEADVDHLRVYLSAPPALAEGTL